ncbi:MAG TPA: RDD family protein [Thermoplasmata archaeon]|nr:RDD family protein [Thermoplasmata archaeon]
MIAPLDLANDIAGDVSALALPALLWALLYQLGWEHSAFAESIGFGRRTFWLLVAGGLLGAIVLLPLTPIANDWLAISFPGALFPLLVVGFGLAALAPARRTVPPFVLLLGVEAAAQLAVVVLLPSAVEQFAGVLAVAAAVPILALAMSRVAPSALPRSSGAVLALLSGVLVVTFATSTAIPGVGIEETFPAYLIGPFVVGFVAAIAAGRYAPGREALALPAAYIAGTLGVLIGADVLREPPLYGTGPSGLYAIGGAGVFDLVYLSGLLAFGGAYLAHRLLRRGFEPVAGATAEVPPPPFGRLNRAFREGVRGQIPTSMLDSAAASRASAAQAHVLLDLPPAPDDRPWQGLPVPGWVVSDQANLDAAARTGSTDGREGLRAFLTARWLVLIGREFGLRRFGSIGARIVAFVIDLLLVTVPAVLVFWAILLATPGSLNAAASSLPYNAAAYGYAALAFLYFALAETVAGTTVGKRLLGLGVRDRHLARPSLEAGLVRNLPKLPSLSVLGIGLAVGVLLLVKAGGGVVLQFAGGFPVSAGTVDFLVVLSVVIGVVGLLGLVGVLGITLTPERQRFGDLVAGTWVVATGTAARPPAGAASPSPAPPAAGPPAG